VKQTFRAEISLPGKTRTITAGFRPTLAFDGRKALSNVEQISPEPLEPGRTGKAVISITWDWPVASPVRANALFLTLEGKAEVGRGRIIEVL